MACDEMAAERTGALIIIGQQSDLRLIAEGGIAIDAKVSVPLLKTYFSRTLRCTTVQSSSKATA